MGVASTSNYLENGLGVSLSVRFLDPPPIQLILYQYFNKIYNIYIFED